MRAKPFNFHVWWLIGELALAMGTLTSCGKTAPAGETSDLNAACFRVSYRTKENAIMGGSATAVAENVAITNSHVVEHRSGGEVELTNAKGLHINGKVIATDRARDIAVIRTAQNVDYVRIVPGAKPGDRVRFFGFGRSGLPWFRIGTVQTANGSKYKSNSGKPEWTFGMYSEPGDSGGGVFNEQNQLVCYLWGGEGSDGSNVGHGYSIQEYVDFAPEIAQHLQQPVDYFCPTCSGGQCLMPGTRIVYGPPTAQPPRVVVAPPPVGNPPLQPLPTAPPQSPAIGKGDFDALQSQIKDLQIQIGNIKTQPGPAGPPGNDGTPGSPGPKGDAGDSATVNIVEINSIAESAIDKRLAALILPVQTLDSSGVRTQYVPLDGHHALQLSPVK